MDRGDTGFIIHESFKDLKTRRAEQEAYRKALEEQIKQKRRLQEKEREKNEVGRRTCDETMSLSLRTPRRAQELPVYLPPESTDTFSSPITPFPGQPPIPSSHGKSRPTSRGYRDNLSSAPGTLRRVLSFNEIDNYNEPHPAVVPTSNVEEKTARGTTTPNIGIPEFSPECMKYLQHVMPGFTLPPLPKTPADFVHSNNAESQKTTASGSKTGNGTSVSNGFYDNSPYDHNNNHAFSSGTTSESSSSVEDVQTQVKTSDQLEGVKVSRKQYREELQKQIDERKRREQEARRKAEEEEERIQEKIRLDQEKMQREYEEELRKQEEREKEAEEKRIATLAKQKEVLRTQEESKTTRKMHDTKEKSNAQDVDLSVTKGSRPDVAANSEDSIESIGEFFDETTIPQGTKYVDPDDRIIPVVAKRLREKALNSEKKSEEKESQQNFSNEKISLTARIDSAFSDPAMIAPQNDVPPPPQQGLIREIAIRSAPCPTTGNSTDLEFLSSLKSYLQCEKNKIDERILAKNSKSTERF